MVKLNCFKGDNPVREVMVRAWGDTKWHEPTADYLGLGE